jgi:hypothetical protein
MCRYPAARQPQRLSSRSAPEASSRTTAAAGRTLRTAPTDSPAYRAMASILPVVPPADSAAGAVKNAIIARRGKEARNIAKVAAARPLLTLVFYGLRNGQIRLCRVKTRLWPLSWGLCDG